MLRQPGHCASAALSHQIACTAFQVLEVEYAITEDKRLRSQLRDPSAIEAQVTALQIASLKKISKGTKVILLDRYGPAARTVAKELTRKGYGKVNCRVL